MPVPALVNNSGEGLPPMNYPRAFFALERVGAHDVIAAGGKASSPCQGVRTCEILDVEGRRWIPLPHGLRTPRACLGSSVIHVAKNE